MPITLDGTNGITQTTGVVTTPAGSASAPAITPDGDSNTGIFFPSADTIAFAEGGVESARIDSSGRLGIGTTPSEQLHITGNFRIGSAVQSTPSGSAPLFSCRAWVNFNGTGTVAIRSSGNVSSITDRGVGLYTANFSTAMPDANYACTSGEGYNPTNPGRNIKVMFYASASNTRADPSTTDVQFVVGDTNASPINLVDATDLCVSVFR